MQSMIKFLNQTDGVVVKQHTGPPRVTGIIAKRRRQWIPS